MQDKSDKIFTIGIGIMIGAFFSVLVCITWPIAKHKQEKELLKAEIRTLEKVALLRDKQLAISRRQLALCQGTLKKPDSSLEDFYNTVMFAQRLQISATDGDGQSVLLTLDCKDGGYEQ